MPTDKKKQPLTPDKQSVELHPPEDDLPETEPDNPPLLDQFNGIKPPKQEIEVPSINKDSWKNIWNNFLHPDFEYKPADPSTETDDNPQKIIGSIYAKDDPEHNNPLINVTNDNKMILPKFTPGSPEENAQIQAITASLDHLAEQNKDKINADNPLIARFQGMDAAYLTKVITELEKKDPLAHIKLESPHQDPAIQKIIQTYNNKYDEQKKNTVAAKPTIEQPLITTDPPSKAATSPPKPK